MEVGLGELIYCEIVLSRAEGLAGLGVGCLVGLARGGCGFDEAYGRFFDGDAFHWAFKHRKNTELESTNVSILNQPNNNKNMGNILAAYDIQSDSNEDTEVIRLLITGFKSIGTLLGPLVLLSYLRFLLGCEVVDDTELLPDFFCRFAYINTGVPLIIVATLAQQSSINDLMSR